MEEYLQRHREAYQRRIAEQRAREEQERLQQATEKEGESSQAAGGSTEQSASSSRAESGATAPVASSGDTSATTRNQCASGSRDRDEAAEAAAAAEAASLEEARRLQRQFEAELEGVRPPDDTYQERLIGEDGPVGSLSWWSHAARLPLEHLTGAAAVEAAAAAGAAGFSGGTAGQVDRREGRGGSRQLTRPHAAGAAAVGEACGSSSSHVAGRADATPPLSNSAREAAAAAAQVTQAWERELLQQQLLFEEPQQEQPEGARREEDDEALARRLQAEELRRSRARQQRAIAVGRSRSPTGGRLPPSSNSSNTVEVSAIDSCPVADIVEHPANIQISPPVPARNTVPSSVGRRAVGVSLSEEATEIPSEENAAAAIPRTVPPVATGAAARMPLARTTAANTRQPQKAEGNTHDVIVIEDSENPSSADESGRDQGPSSGSRPSNVSSSLPPFPATPAAANTSFTSDQCLQQRASIVPGSSALISLDPENEAAAAAAAAGIEVDSEEAILQAAIAQSLVDM